jgi:hypothetical protein
METVLKLLNRICIHPFTTVTGHVETCSWCLATRRLYLGGEPGAWVKESDARS